MLLPLLALLLLAPAAAQAQIPQTPDSDAPPDFSGEPWSPEPVYTAPSPRSSYAKS